MFTRYEELLKMRLGKLNLNTRFKAASSREDSALNLLHIRVRGVKLLVPILLVFIAGCLAPFMGDRRIVRILAPTDSGYAVRAGVEFRPVGDTIKMLIMGEHIPSDSEMYRLDLWIILDRLEPGGLIVVNPDSLSVSFEGSRMLRHSDRNYPPDTVDGNSYKKKLEFNLAHPSLRDTVRTLEEKPGIGARLMISFDGFLYFNGRRINLDSVRAVDPYVDNLVMKYRESL